LTTLKGKELFDYLTDLEGLITRHHPGSAMDFSTVMHTQMCKIVQAERTFLTNYHQKLGLEPQMSISLQGMPSIESLRADMETICNLSEESSFKEVAERYKKSIEAQQTEIKYIPVMKEEFEEALSRQDQNKLAPKIGFKISQSEDDEIFRLDVREEIFKKGYDEYSRKYPILIREGSMRYRVIWGDNLVSQHTEQYYIPEEATKCDKIIIKPSEAGTELAKANPKKRKRIEILEKSIKTLDSFIAEAERDQVEYDTSLSRFKTSQKVLLELERKHTGQFIISEADPYTGHVISKKNFLTNSIIATIQYSHHTDTVSNLLLQTKNYKLYLDTFKRLFPNSKIELK